jgi:hypothetical protein
MLMALMEQLHSGAGFMIGAYGFTDAGITNAETIKPPKSAPDASIELETSPEQVFLFYQSSVCNACN